MSPLQIHFVLAVSVYFLCAKAAPSALNFRDLFSESKPVRDYFYQDIELSDGNDIRGYNEIDNVVHEDAPVLYFNRQGKQLLINNVDKTLIRDIEKLIALDPNYRNKRAEGSTQKYVAPCFYKICSIGKRTPNEIINLELNY